IKGSLKALSERYGEETDRGLPATTRVGAEGSSERIRRCSRACCLDQRRTDGLDQPLDGVYIRVAVGTLVHAFPVGRLVASAGKRSYNTISQEPSLSFA